MAASVWEVCQVLTCSLMLMHAIAHGGCTDTVRVCTESWLCVKSPSRTRIGTARSFWVQHSCSSKTPLTRTAVMKLGPGLLLDSVRYCRLCESVRQQSSSLAGLSVTTDSVKSVKQQSLSLAALSVTTDSVKSVKQQSMALAALSLILLSFYSN